MRWLVPNFTFRIYAPRLSISRYAEWPPNCSRSSREPSANSRMTRRFGGSDPAIAWRATSAVHRSQLLRSETAPPQRPIKSTSNLLVNGWLAARPRSRRQSVLSPGGFQGLIQCYDPPWGRVKSHLASGCRKIPRVLTSGGTDRSPATTRPLLQYSAPPPEHGKGYSTASMSKLAYYRVELEL